MSPLKLDKFVKPSDPVLTLIAQSVDIKDIEFKETQNSINEMFTVAYGEQKDANKPLLVGLAAPQVGISKRIILVDVIADGKGKVGDLRLYINPEIIWFSKEQKEWYEGCFSTSRVCGIVSRPDKIKIRAFTKEGEIVEEEYSGYTARIFQHEIDHLNGKEFTTHITDDNNLHWVEEEEFPKYRNEEGWRDWLNKCPREKWNEIKRIK
ncbi:MAG: peptide deformylase [Patescibacteria group bacterium]